MRWIFAIGLTALLWATSIRTGPVPPVELSARGPAALSMAEACAVTGDAPDHDSDQQWRAAHQAIAVVTESVWKSAPVHAELGATRSARVFELARPVSSPAPPVSAAPLYLLHTPLLI